VKHTNQLELFKQDNYEKYKGEKQICKVCQQEKPLDHFYRCGVDGIDNRCIPCFRKESDWRREQREIYKHLDTGHCHCCGKEHEKALHFDHDHDTLQFRGWLCINCNQGIGKLGDNMKGLNRALAYLKKCYETKR